MERRITTGTMVAMAFSVVLAYAAPHQQPRDESQQPRQREPQTHTPPSAGAPPGAATPGIGGDKGQETTTMIGCLHQGTSPRSFVFTQSPGTSVPNGGVGTAGAREQQGNRYDLIPDSKTDLSKMVGKQVEVTGARAGTQATPPGQTRNSSDAALTRFTLKTIKQTGPSC